MLPTFHYAGLTVLMLTLYNPTQDPNAPIQDTYRNKTREQYRQHERDAQYDRKKYDGGGEKKKGDKKDGKKAKEKAK